MAAEKVVVSQDLLRASSVTHKIKSAQSVRRPPSTSQIQVDLTTVKDAPSMAKAMPNPFYSSNLFKFGLVPLLVVSVCACVAVPVGIAVRSNMKATSTAISTTSTTMTTNTETTSTSITTTSVTTTSVTTTSATTTTTTPYICSPSCVNGNCTNTNVCTCNTGWYGSTCSLPNCTNPCQNNGTCIAPNICNCTSGWNGSVCQSAICTSACLNGGNCTAPNTCTCVAGVWSGALCQIAVRFFLSFDNTLQDANNLFTGNATNGLTYVSPGYNGAGACLWLNRSLFQSVTYSTPPFLSLVSTSFTFEVWMYPQTFCNNISCTDNDIIGQSQNTTADRTLHLILRNRRVLMAFYTDDVTGNQVLSAGAWYHVAFVYDYSVRTQYIYINGYLDISRTSAGPYLGTSGALTIGTTAVYSPNNGFDGCLDSISYINRAKNASEIMNDATWVACFSFDNSAILDSGPLSVTGTGTNCSFTSSGRVNGALALWGSLSYVQIPGLIRLGTVGWPYSLAIWINPANATGGTVVFGSYRADGSTAGWCLGFMGFTLTGQIAINSWNSTNVPVTGPQIPLNAWTHVVATYSSSNGLRLYVNGTLSNSVSSYSFVSSGLPMIITLGSSLYGTSTCRSGTIQMGQYNGLMDEFCIYARELNATEIIVLANP